VTANSLAPGAIAGTEGMERLASSLVTAADLGKGIPSGRWGRVKDIADATVYLFSDAGNYVNGTTLVVDGAGWRRQGGVGVGLDPGMQYPDFLFAGVSKHVKSGRKEKL
jgi:peroxisomal 2,4-dienoyl-CoA reductase